MLNTFKNESDCMTMTANISCSKKSENSLGDELSTLVVNDSLSLVGSQQHRRRLNRIHNQSRCIGRIVWNEKTKQTEVQYDPPESKLSNADTNKVDSQDLLRNDLQKQNLEALDTSSLHDIDLATDLSNSSTKRLYREAEQKINRLSFYIEQLERDLNAKEQAIKELERRRYERTIAQLEEELKRSGSIKSDNGRLREENAALIRIVTKLSK